MEQALKQLELPQLPRLIGKTDDGTELIAANGPFGPYLKAGNHNIQLNRANKEESPYTIRFELANQLYQKKKSSIIADWGEIKIIHGPFGPYIKGPAIKPASGKGRPRPNNLKIPADLDPKTITLEQATSLLEEKTAPAKKTKVRTTKTTKKSAVKKTTTKKTASKKTTTK